ELESEEAAPRIAASAISEQLLAALVDWGNIHPDPARKEKLAELLRSVDHNPWRRQVWDALGQQGGSKLAHLTQSAEALDQPPGRLEVLGRILARFDKRAAVKFLRQAQQRHPDDFWINHQLAFYFAKLGPPQLEEAIGFYRAALALRPHSPGVHVNLGNALGNKGQLDEAIVEYREAIRLKKDYAEAHCNLGQCLVQKGQFQQAVEELRLGHKLGSRNPRWPYPSAQWVRNAERLVALDHKLSVVLEGKEKPADVAERLAFAQLCQMYRKHHAAAARFYGEAFDLQKNLTDDRQVLHRYNAACSAALAGYGEGKDAPSEEAERAHLRRRALDWLRADLKTEGELLKSWWPGKADATRKRLEHWLVDPDFNGVRGEKALAKLPKAEREAWQKLWQGVEALRQQAAVKTKPPTAKDQPQGKEGSPDKD
ncbi:MAG TPA: tetratricopeptide repeat protein, partial [Gemmataceae bacterium]